MFCIYISDILCLCFVHIFVIHYAYVLYIQSTLCNSNSVGLSKIVRFAKSSNYTSFCKKSQKCLIFPIVAIN